MSLTLPGMLSAALREVFEVDGRFIKTVRTMLLHPGRITREFLANRWAGYLPPFRIYLFASVALYFSLNLLTANVTLSIDLGDDPIDATQGMTTGESGMIGSLQNRLSAAAGSAEFGKSVYQHLPEVGFVLLPFLALLFKALYFKRRRAIGEHLLAAVHMKTGVFVLFIAAAIGSGIARAAGWTAQELANPATAAASVASAAYVGLSLHTVYGGRVWLSVVRTMLVISIYWIMATIGLLGVAVILVLNSSS